MSILTFDIETIPDWQRAATLYNLPDLAATEVIAVVQEKRRNESGSEWFRPYLQQVVAISVVLQTDNQFRIWSVGDLQANEGEIIQRFFDGIDKYVPTLVSWNGSQFDLPVLHYRGLINGITAARYFESGERDTRFKYNNYLNRYHERHVDLMDVLAAFSPRNYAPLDELARLLNFPGKMDMSGAKVWDYYAQNRIDDIRNYCETDVLNTHLIFLQFQLLRGIYTPEQLQNHHEQLKITLAESQKPHLLAYLQRWNELTSCPKTNYHA